MRSKWLTHYAQPSFSSLLKFLTTLMSMEESACCLYEGSRLLPGFCIPKHCLHEPPERHFAGVPRRVKPPSSPWSPACGYSTRLATLLLASRISRS
jgi:hypothetical protein